VFTLLTSLGALSSAMGYSRDLEREADVLGFKLLVDAGYSPLASGQVFRLFMEESTRANQKEPFFFGSHPRLAERSASFRELAAALPTERRESGTIGVEELEAILPEVLILNSQACLQKGDLQFARESAERAMRLRPTDARTVCAVAETYRRQPGAADRDAAARYYREALALDAKLPEAHRGLGLELMKSGDRDGAAQAFRRYLQLAPDAADQAHIQEFIRQCETKS
jgi:predicted Zn-dependent protease